MSKYIGVRHTAQGYEAICTRHGSEVHLGFFADQELAGQAHDVAAAKVALDEGLLLDQINDLLNDTTVWDEELVAGMRKQSWGEVLALIRLGGCCEAVTGGVGGADQAGGGCAASGAGAPPIAQDDAVPAAAQSSAECGELAAAGGQQSSGAGEAAEPPLPPVLSPAGLPAMTAAAAADRSAGAAPGTATQGSLPAAPTEQGRGQGPLWQQSGQGEFIRQITADVFQNSRLSLPGVVLSGLGLEGCSEVDLVHPPSQGRWRVGMWVPANLSRGPTMRVGLKAALSALGLQDGGTLALRRLMPAGGTAPGSPPELEVAPGGIVGTADGGGAEESGAAAPRLLLPVGPRYRKSGSRPRRYWERCREGPGWERDVAEATLQSLRFNVKMAADLGIEETTSSLTLTHQGQQWCLRVCWSPDGKGRMMVMLQKSRWCEVVRGTGIELGDTITLAPNPAAAPQPAVALGILRHSSGADPGNELTGDHQALSAAGLLGALCNCGDSGGGSRVAGAKRSAARQQAEPAQPAKLAWPSRNAQVGRLAAGAAPALEAAAAVSPPLPPLPAPASGGMGQQAMPQLQPLAMFRAIKPAVEGCGAPSTACSAYLRLYLNRLSGFQQLAHYEEIVGSHAAGAAAAVREWVEGSLEDFAPRRER